MGKRWDTVIKNGLVFDGSGELPVLQDIAIANGLVVARRVRCRCCTEYNRRFRAVGHAWFG